LRTAERNRGNAAAALFRITPEDMETNL
jgi:hypothetical protein